MIIMIIIMFTYGYYLSCKMTLINIRLKLPTYLKPETNLKKKVKQN